MANKKNKKKAHQQAPANNGGPNGYWYDNTGATFGAGVKLTDRTTVGVSGNISSLACSMKSESSS